MTKEHYAEEQYGLKGMLCDLLKIPYNMGVWLTSSALKGLSVAHFLPLHFTYHLLRAKHTVEDRVNFPIGEFSIINKARDDLLKKSEFGSHYVTFLNTLYRKSRKDYSIFDHLSKTEENWNEESYQNFKEFRLMMAEGYSALLGISFAGMVVGAGYLENYLDSDNPMVFLPLAVTNFLGYVAAHRLKKKFQETLSSSNLEKKIKSKQSES